MYKSIIPNLVSLETDLNIIPGWYLSGDFNYFPGTPTKNKFHFKVGVKENIKLPQMYDFRNGYFLRYRGIRYYQRKLGPVDLRFEYSPFARSFHFNSFYRLLPFEIGFIFPVGRHICDLINFQMFLQGYVLMRGCSFQLRGKNICVAAPAFNGKTSLVYRALSMGAKYISEDVLVLDYFNGKIYPHSVVTNNKRPSNEVLKKSLYSKDVILKSVKIDKFYLMQNTTNTHYVVPKKNVVDYFHLTSLFFLNNPFIKSYIFSEHLARKMVLQIQKVVNYPINFEQVHAKNFNFEKILG